jgi:hypothetical protein
MLGLAPEADNVGDAMPIPPDDELRAMLRSDFEASISGPRTSGVLAHRLMRVICWFGLAVSVALLGGAVWFHANFDPIIRIPFVFGAAILALGLGFPCLTYLVTGKLIGPGRLF